MSTTRPIYVLRTVEGMRRAFEEPAMALRGIVHPFDYVLCSDGRMVFSEGNGWLVLEQDDTESRYTEEEVLEAIK